MSALNPFGWVDSASAPQPTVSATNAWDVLNRGLDAYVTVRRQEAELDVQAQIAKAAAAQSRLMLANPQQYNADAQVVPGAAWAGLYGATPIGAPSGGMSMETFMLISALGAGLWFLLDR